MSVYVPRTADEFNRVVFDSGRIVAIGRETAALTQLLDSLVKERRAA
jgi:hypothetical protein